MKNLRMLCAAFAPPTLLGAGLPSVALAQAGAQGAGGQGGYQVGGRLAGPAAGAVATAQTSTAARKRRMAGLDDGRRPSV